MRSPRVAIDLRLAGVRTGGISRYATELYLALRKYGTLDIRSVRNRSDRVFEPGNYQFWTPPHHKYERFGLAVETLLFARGLDLFHATDFISPGIPGLPTIATVHDLAFLEHPEYLQSDALNYYQQLGRSRMWTSGWITPSVWTANALQSAFDIERADIHVIPHGAPEGYSLREPVERRRRGNYLLAVGTVEPRKQYDVLLDAMTLLQGEVDQLQLIVVGSPGWRSQETQEWLLTHPGVVWHKYATESELRDLYRNAICLLIPSQSEGFGFAALESMASGTPVISSGGGALNEVTGNAALIPTCASGEAWAETIQQLLSSDRIWECLAQAGLERASLFSWKNAALQTEAAYRRVLNLIG